MGYFDFEDTSKNISNELGKQRGLLKTDLESVVSSAQHSFIEILTEFRRKILIPILATIIITVFLFAGIAGYAIGKFS